MVDTSTPRVVKAVHGLEKHSPDPDFEIGLAQYLQNQYAYRSLLDLYARFFGGDGEFDGWMRRAIWRSAARKLGHGVRIGSGVGVKHLETFEIGDQVFIGSQGYIQGRFDDVCQIGNHVWIGPQSYFDARALIIEDYVGWGSGAKVLGSAHTGLPVDIPIVLDRPGN
jgi:acetyltransferase-like isoleucine patch superfamily enzyme